MGRRAVVESHHLFERLLTGRSAGTHNGRLRVRLAVLDTHHCVDLDIVFIPVSTAVSCYLLELS